mgnify:FL=1
MILRVAGRRDSRHLEAPDFERILVLELSATHQLRLLLLSILRTKWLAPGALSLPAYTLHPGCAPMNSLFPPE